MPAKKKSEKHIVRGGVPDDDDLTEGMSLFQLADLYGRLDASKQKLLANPIFTRHAEVEAALKARITATYKPQDAVEIRGKTYVVEFDAAFKAPRRIDDNEKALEVLGVDTFLSLARLNVTDVEQHLTPEQQKKVIVTPKEYIDRRRVTVRLRKNPNATEVGEDENP
jgi:hypothetical protein